MSPQKETIVLTGATGNLGAVTLEHLLPLGHTVDLILRNGNKAIPHFEAKFPEAVASGQLTFTSVSGLAGPGVFDGPAAKATAIIHLATPLASSNIEEEMIKPTWEIDLGVLEAAKKSKTVKRVVICGTILQAMRLDELQDVNLTVREDRYNDITLDEATQGIIPGYQYAKTNAEKKVWEWVKQHESNGGLGFDVVMLLPPSIIGRSPQMGWKPSADALGGNGSVYRALFAGLGEEAVGSAFPIIMNNDDVAHCHVLALNRDKVPGNERYLVASPERLDLRKVVNVLRREDPEIAQRIPAFEETGVDIAAKIVRVDTSKADKVFGTEWKGAVESVRAVAKDVLNLERL